MTLRILLIDDNQTFLTAVKSFLATLPQVQVVGEAHDGPTALLLAAKLQPELVLLDIVMPNMNGLEVAAALRKTAAAACIVFLSMHDSLSYRVAALELGARGYVGKGDFVVELEPLINAIADEIAGAPL